MVNCKLCKGPLDYEGYCERAACRAAAEDWPDPYRSFDRSTLDESDMTAVQCDGCGAWATVYYRADAWTADRDQESAHYCAKCDPERATGEYGHQPQGWVNSARCTDGPFQRGGKQAISRNTGGDMFGVFVEMGNGPQSDVCVSYARTALEAEAKREAFAAAWHGRRVYVSDTNGRPCR